MMVHEGFLKAYQHESSREDDDGMLTISHSLSRQLQYYLRFASRVMFVGHSMGGALATVKRGTSWRVKRGMLSIRISIESFDRGLACMLPQNRLGVGCWV